MVKTKVWDHAGVASRVDGAGGVSRVAKRIRVARSSLYRWMSAPGAGGCAPRELYRKPLAKALRCKEADLWK